MTQFNFPFPDIVGPGPNVGQAFVPLGRRPSPSAVRSPLLERLPGSLSGKSGCRQNRAAAGRTLDRLERADGNAGNVAAKYSSGTALSS